MDSARHKFTKQLLNHRPFRNALIVLTVLSVFLGLLIVPIEATHPHPNITTFEEGLWWASTTVTGVGYGDFYPVTTMGRLVGTSLQVSGVMMFGLLIGIIGITMTKRQEEYYWFRLFERIDSLETKLQRLERHDALSTKHQIGSQKTES
jgi:voltage-gated potassium channel